MIANVKALLAAASGGERRIYRKFLTGTILCGAADFLIIFLLLEEVSDRQKGLSSEGNPIAFLAAVGLFYLLTTSQYQQGAWLFTKSARDRAIRIAQGLLRLPLAELEAMERGMLMTRLLGDSSRVSTSSRAVLGSLNSGLRLLWASVLALTVSAPVSVVAFCGLLLVSMVAFQQLGALREGYRQTGNDEALVYDLLQAHVRGMIPIKLHRPRADALDRGFKIISERLRALRSSVFGRFYDHQYTVDALLFALLGANVFLAPLFSATAGQSLRQMNLIILWLLRAAVSVLTKMPQVSEAAVALQRLQALEAQLHEDRLEPPPTADGLDDRRFNDFSVITTHGLGFRYARSVDSVGFTIGPIDLTLRRGELIYITGQNGGGKSTFLKLLTGLYRRSAGEIQVDGVAIDNDSQAAYRALFGTIFADHSLYAQVPGFTPAAEIRATALLNDLGLGGKTAISGGRVTERNLSTGQKKRLAMVLVRLRDRPILIFDEWAADQDPEYREIYYRQLLPALRDEGKLVIVATHDDQYFHLADRVLVFHQGTLTEAMPQRDR